MSYDPGKIIPDLVCPNCGFVGLMKIVGNDATCNQCGWIQNYAGSKAGFPNLFLSGQKFISDPKYPSGTEPPTNAPRSILLPHDGGSPNSGWYYGGELVRHRYDEVQIQDCT